MKAHGPWQIVSSRDIYRDSWIDVRRDDVLRPDGQSGTHCVVTLKSGVSVLAVDDTQHVYLTEEFHYAIGRVATEVVSGGIEPDETPEQTVRRELREELGLVADRWTSWGNLDPISSVIAAPVALFLAEGLTAVPRAPEPT
jgi:ADP-ribose pyrophosphatase